MVNRTKVAIDIRNARIVATKKKKTRPILPDVFRRKIVKIAAGIVVAVDITVPPCRLIITVPSIKFFNNLLIYFSWNFVKDEH
jgi:hypothetical protein